MIKLNLKLANSLFKVDNNDVIKDVKSTYLTSKADATNITLTVQNIAGAATSGYVIMGKIGSENTELVQIHTLTSPTGSTITLTGAISFSHATNTKIYFIDYNQIEFSRATTSGGSKSVLTTSAITPDEKFTIYNDTTNSTGYGYVRFKNSTTSVYSNYSDEQIYASLAHNSIGKIIDRVFRKSGEEEGQALSRIDIADFIWDYIDTVNDLRNQWKHEEASEDKSNTLTIGGEELSLPSDIKYNNPKSIINIGMEGYDPLTYIGLTTFRKKISGLARTTLDGAVLSGAVTMNLKDASNFPSSGNGYIAGDAFSWTGKSTNQLTGVTGVLAHDNGAVVFHEDALGQPTYYTIQNEVIRIQPAPDSEYNGFLVPIDYYKRLSYPDSENDLLPLPYVSPCIDYCLMCVNDSKGDSGKNESVKFERRFDKKITQTLRNERLNKDQSWVSLE